MEIYNLICHKTDRSKDIPAEIWFDRSKDRSRMERLINKLKRSGFLPESAPSAAALAGEADERLFSAVLVNIFTVTVVRLL